MWDADDDCCTQRCTAEHPCTEGQGHCTSNTDCQVMCVIHNPAINTTFYTFSFIENLFKSLKVSQPYSYNLDDVYF